MNRLRRRDAAAAALLCIALACSFEPEPEPMEDIGFELRIEPTPPARGEADLSLHLTGPDGPIEGARVEVEGNMSHAGMKPTFAELREVAPGRYEGRLHLSMGGDWFLLVSAVTPAGRRLERVVELPGVRAM